MALSAEGLQKALLAATDGVAPEGALSKLGEAIAKYIADNAEVSFSWVALNPAGTPDTITTAKGKIQNLAMSLTASKAEIRKEAMDHMIGELVTGLSAAMYNITDVGFATSPMPMAYSPTITNLNLSIAIDLDNDTNDREESMLQLAGCVIDWVKLQKPTTPVPGAHAPFVGSPGGMVSGIT
ncbi:MAG: hypothetical protein ABUK01_00475 [Leptospirales bacterium]